MHFILDDQRLLSPEKIKEWAALAAGVKIAI